MTKPTLDDFETDFESAMKQFADEHIARIEQETRGMNDLQRKQYFLSNARRHLNECEKLNAPDIIITRAKENIARLELEIKALKNS